MKTLKSLVPVFLLFIAATVAVSCSDDETSSSSSVITTPNLEDIIASDSGHMTWHEYYSKILAKAEEGNSAEATAMAEWAKTRLHEADSLTQALADSLGFNGDSYLDQLMVGFAWHKLNYKSIDENGNDITLSTLVAYPWGTFWDPHPDNLIIGCHSNVTSKSACPTNFEVYNWLDDVYEMIVHAGTLGWQALVVLPDYQGFGVSETHVHPYLQLDLMARQVVDAAIQAKTWYEANHKSMDEGWATLVEGGTTGASMAMATQRYIEKHNLSGKLNFKGSICAGGIYDPLATVRSYISKGKVYTPSLLACIIKGLCDCNSRLKGLYTPEDFLAEGFVGTGFLQDIEQKNASADKLKSYKDPSGAFFMQEDKTGYYCTVSQVLRPEVIAYLKNGTLSDQYKDKLTRLQQALEDNNLTCDWTPQHPMIVFHSKKDEVVPYINYTNALQAFKESGMFKGQWYEDSNSWEELAQFRHEETCSEFFSHYEAYYIGSLLKNLDWINHGSIDIEAINSNAPFKKPID